jgi:TolA-binding protein
MNDPDRLLESDQSALVRTMISAAREERPNDRALQRTLLAVGAGGAVLGATAAAGGAMGSSALQAGGTTSLGAIVKWLGIGATAGLVTAGTAIQIEQQVSPPGVPAVATVQAPVRAPEQPPPAPATAIAAAAEDPKPEPVKRPAAIPSEPAPALVEDDPSLNAEVVALDRARKALASGNSEGALAELGSYDREFPGGRLGPEALFLRMEASVKKGDRAAAERAARELVANHPKSPHAARARAVLSGASQNP